MLVYLICCVTTVFSQSEKGLFETDSVLEISLTGDVKKLLSDRSGEDLQYHPLVLSYRKADGSIDSMPIQAKTRGNFRRMRSNCIYPPVFIDFKDGVQKQTIFKKQDKMKVVMPCVADEYVVREWLVYKLYNIVTPNSFRARLARLTLNQTGKQKPYGNFYCILLEEEEQMAKRNKKISVERKMIPQQAEPGSFLKMAVFEYLVGNTDWSIEYLQNIKLLAADSFSLPIPVAYDFDHAGIVNAPYARPAQELNMSSIRERRYRGYCIEDIKEFDSTIAFYNQVKNDVYKLYTDCTFIDEKYKRSTVEFLDEFYETINDADRVKKEFSYPCDKYGTGNVIIKGLQHQ